MTRECQASASRSIPSRPPAASYTVCISAENFTSRAGDGNFATLSRQLAGERVAEVEARSAGLRKELGLVDLVLMQIMYVVGSAWVGTAAKLGSSHTVFWLL